MLELLSKIELPSGLVLQKGDWIRLGDKVGDGYKQTKFYDVSIKQELALYRYDANDFKFIELLPEIDGSMDIERKEVAIPVHKFLSLFEDEFQFFKLENEKFYGFSNFFKIDIESAFEFEECQQIPNSEKRLYENQALEVELIKVKQSIVDTYSIEIFSEQETMHALEDYNLHYFQKQSKWAINYYQSITGEYHKK